MKSKAVQQAEYNYKQIHNKLRKAGFIALFIVLGTILLLLLIIRKAKDVHSVKNMVVKSTEVEEKKERAKKMFEEYSQKNAKIRALFPNSSDIAEFVTRIEELAFLSGSDIEFNFVTDKVRKDENGYSYLDYTMQMKSDLNGLLVFLDRFERIAYMTSIREISSQNLSRFEGSGDYIIRAAVYVEEPFSK